MPGLVTLTGLCAQFGSLAMNRIISMPKSARFFGLSTPSPRGLHSSQAMPLASVALAGRSSARL